MTLTYYSALAFSSLFAVVDPVAAVPAFVAMTANDPPATQLRMARLASTVAAGMLILFALAGKWIFQFMGITLPAFQIAGSILLLRIALDMLYARRSAAQETNEEVEAGAAKEDIAITPLGVPMLAGPGSISTALILMNETETPLQKVALVLSILAVGLSCYLVLRLTVLGARWISPLALKLITRLMGLLLAAISVQFMLNALKQLGVPIRPV